MVTKEDRFVQLCVCHSRIKQSICRLLGFSVIDALGWQNGSGSLKVIFFYLFRSCYCTKNMSFWESLKAISILLKENVGICILLCSVEFIIWSGLDSSSFSFRWALNWQTMCTWGSNSIWSTQCKDSEKQGTGIFQLVGLESSSTPN